MARGGNGRRNTCAAPARSVMVVPDRGRLEPGGPAMRRGAGRKTDYVSDAEVIEARRRELDQRIAGMQRDAFAADQPPDPRDRATGRRGRGTHRRGARARCAEAQLVVLAARESRTPG